MLDDWIELDWLEGDPDKEQIHLSCLPDRNIQQVVPWIFFQKEQPITELPIKQSRQSTFSVIP